MNRSGLIAISSLLLWLAVVSALPGMHAQMQALATVSPTAVIPACANVTEPAAAATMDMSAMGGMGTATTAPTAGMGSIGMTTVPTAQTMDMSGMAMGTATTAPTGPMSGMDMNMPTAAPTIDVLPSIHIVSPRDQDMITGSHIDILVQVDNVTLGAEQHLHVYLDGKLAIMVYTAFASLDNISAGKHDICVVLADDSHKNMSIMDGITVITT